MHTINDGNVALEKAAGVLHIVGTAPTFVDMRVANALVIIFKQSYIALRHHARGWIGETG